MAFTIAQQSKVRTITTAAALRLSQFDRSAPSPSTSAISDVGYRPQDIKKLSFFEEKSSSKEPTSPPRRADRLKFHELLEKLGRAYDSDLREVEERLESERASLQRQMDQLRRQEVAWRTSLGEGRSSLGAGQRFSEKERPEGAASRRQKKACTSVAFAVVPSGEAAPDLNNLHVPGRQVSDRQDPITEQEEVADDGSAADDDDDDDDDNDVDEEGDADEGSERFPMHSEYARVEGTPAVTDIDVATNRIGREVRRQMTVPALETYKGFMQYLIATPRSPVRMVWEIFAAMFVVYDMFLVPLAVFCYKENGFTITMDWVTLIFWTLNVINTITLGYDLDAHTIMDPYEILVHYLKFWFWIDLVVLVPDWALTALSVGTRRPGTSSCASDASGSSSVRLLRTLRLVRLVRLARVARLRKMWDVMQSFIYSLTISIATNILAMVTLLLVISHYISCVWYLISYVSQGDERWIVAHEMEHRAWYYQYTTSLHWSITQFTPASMQIVPHNTAERIFTIAVVVFALVGFSYVVGSITGSLTQLRSLHEEESKLFWDLRVYLKRHNVDLQLSNRIQRYLEHSWQTEARSKGHKDVKILGYLSEQLYNELLFELSAKHLKVHPLFEELQSVNRVTVYRLASAAISSKRLAKHDLLFILGEKPSHMYIVVQGQLEYTRDNSRDDEMEIVDKGEDWIAEPVLWSTKWFHLGDCVAREETRLMLVEPIKLCEVVKRNPKAWLLVTTYCRKFVNWLNSTDFDTLSDITQGEDEEVRQRIKLFMEVEKHVDDTDIASQTPRKGRSSTKENAKASPPKGRHPTLR